MMSSSPLVSIGLMTYNRSWLLRQAIDSLLAQTYRNFELIISDNASTDDTRRVGEEYAKKDKRIRYIRQSKNIGGDNLNFVLLEARGEYFMWAADDDLWEPDFISELVGIHQRRGDAVVAFCAWDIIDFSGKILKSDSLAFPENKYFTAYQRFKMFLLNREKEKNSYIYGIFKKKYLGNRLAFRKFKGVPDIHNPSDTFSNLEMIVKGPFVSALRVLHHKRCNINDFMPERTVRDLGVFSDKRLFIGKVINFAKTPYYFSIHYVVINGIIRKSFPRLYDRYRLYFFNTCRFFISVLKIIPWVMKLASNLLFGLLDNFKRRVKLRGR